MKKQKIFALTMIGAGIIAFLGVGGNYFTENWSFTDIIAIILGIMGLLIGAGLLFLNR